MMPLNQFLLISVAVIAIIGLIYFLRKPGNRHPMETPRGRAIEEGRREDAIAARTNSAAVENASSTNTVAGAPPRAAQPVPPAPRE